VAFHVSVGCFFVLVKDRQCRHVQPAISVVYIFSVVSRREEFYEPCARAVDL
jgi:hypothetical protein